MVLRFFGQAVSVNTPAEQSKSSALIELKNGYNKQNHEQQVSGFCKLAKYFLEKNNYWHSSALYTYALAILEDDEQCKVIQGYLVDIERRYLKDIKSEAQASSWKIHQQRRQKLIDWRKLIKEQLPVVNVDSQYDVETLYKNISNEYRRFISQLIEDSMQKLSDEDQRIFKNTGYAIIGFGSLARDEATPYSDLEFGILLEEEAIDKEVFIRFTNLLYLQILYLGETTPRMQHIEPLTELDMLGRFSISPVRNGIAFDGGQATPLRFRNEQYELIATPKNMAQLLKKSLSENSQLYTTLGTACFLTGDASLFEKYNKASNEIIDQQQKKAKALSLFTETANRFDPKMGFYLIQGHSFNVKYDFYRPLTLTIDHLISFYKIPTTTGHSIWQRIEALEKHPTITGLPRNYFGDLRWLSNYINFLRIKAYIHYDAQVNRLVIDTGESTKDFVISESELFSIYNKIIPLNCRAKDFSYNRGSESFASENENPIYHDEEFFTAQIYQGIRDYEKAIEQYNALVQKYCGNKFAQAAIHNCLANVYYFRGEHNLELQHAKMAWEAIKEEDEHVAKVKIKAALAGAYYHVCQYKQAEATYKEALDLINESDKEQVYYAVLLSNAAQFYRSRGKNAKDCLTLLRQSRQVHAICKSIGEAYVTTMYVLADDLTYLNRLDEAEDIYQETLALIAENLGENHPKAIEVYESLARLYIEKGDLQQASDYVKQGIQRHWIYEENISSRVGAHLLNTQGRIFYLLDQYEKAKEYFSGAIRMLEVEYGEDAIETVFTRFHLANCNYVLTQNKESFKEKLQAVIELFDAKDSSNHPNKAFICERLGSLYFEDNDFDQAKRYFAKALDVYEKHSEQEKVCKLKETINACQDNCALRPKL